jgi:S1-C subfamily serine protease
MEQRAFIAIRHLKSAVEVGFVVRPFLAVRDFGFGALSELHAERRTNEPFELTVRELTLDTLLGQRLAPETPGVVVDGVTRAGWSGLSGLYKGLIIQRINELEVVDLDTFEAALALVEENRPEQVLFFVRYGRTTRFLVAEPDWDDVVSGAP